MTDLQYRQQKIQEKRKQTPWREFVRDLGSRLPFSFYRENGLISRYQKTDRIGGIVKTQQFLDLVKEKDIDHTSFFKQFAELTTMNFSPNVIHYGGSENSDYSDIILNSKNVYLSNTVIVDCEDIAYSHAIKEGSSQVLNSVVVRNNSNNIYKSKAIINSSHIFYSKFIENSFELRFCDNCISCNHCIGCSNLMNKSYCIDNIQLTKEQYEQQKAIILHAKDTFDTKYAGITNSGNNVGSTDVTGSAIYQSEHIESGQILYQNRNGRNVMFVGGKGVNENIYDFISGGTIGNHDFYGVISAGAGSNHLYCCVNITGSSSMYYCNFCMDCSYCLGCTGLKNKSFCIFNKQYTKEEREEKADKLFAQMDQEGTLGEFFPGWMSPFYFNDTAAYLIDPSFTKEEVTAQGYLRREDPIKVDIPEGIEVISTRDLGTYEGRIVDGQFISLADETPSSHPSSDGERTIHPDILKKVIQDESGNFYRIIPMEYKFLKKYALPLPRLHWLDRLKANLCVE